MVLTHMKTPKEQKFTQNVIGKLERPTNYIINQHLDFLYRALWDSAVSLTMTNLNRFTLLFGQLLFNNSE